MQLTYENGIKTTFGQLDQKWSYFCTVNVNIKIPIYKIYIVLFFPLWIVPFICFNLDKSERSIFRWILYIGLFPFSAIYWFMTSETPKLEKKWRWLVVVVFVMSFAISTIIFTDPIRDGDDILFFLNSRAGGMAMVLAPIALIIITYNALKYRVKIKNCFDDKVTRRN